MLTRFANPARFMRVSGAALPWFGAAAAAVLAVGLGWSLVIAPPDYQQGESVRIMFIHVPAAWMALSVYLFVAVASAVALVWRHPWPRSRRRRRRRSARRSRWCASRPGRCGGGRCGVPGGCGTRA